MLPTSLTVGRTQNAFFKEAKIVTPKVLDEFKYSRFIEYYISSNALLYIIIKLN